MAYSWKSLHYLKPSAAVLGCPSTLVEERSLICLDTHFQWLVSDDERIHAHLSGLHLVVFACLILLFWILRANFSQILTEER